MNRLKVNKGAPFGNDNAAKDHINKKPEFQTYAEVGGYRDYDRYDNQNYYGILKDFGGMKETWLYGMPPPLQQAVYDYSHDGYGFINKWLRNGAKLTKEQLNGMGVDERNQHSEYMRKRVHQIDASMRPLEQDIIVYRGVNTVVPEDDAFSDAAYVSTSIDPRVPQGYQYLLRIRVPRGTLVAYGLYSGGQESEIILHRDAQFQMTGHSKTSWGKLVYTADLVK